MTHKELAIRIEKEFYAATRDSWGAAATAAFAALGVTPDPELPPGPWRYKQCNVSADAVVDGNQEWHCTVEDDGRAMLRAAVAAWNKANGYE